MGARLKRLRKESGDAMMLQWDETLRGREIPLEMRRVRRHPVYPLHSHAFTELVVVLGGSGLHLTGSISHPIGPGDVIVLQSGQTHGYAETKDLDIANILFDLRRLNLPGSDLRSMPGFHALFIIEPVLRGNDRPLARLRIKGMMLRRVGEILEQMEAEDIVKSPGWVFASTALFMLLVTCLVREYSRIGEPSTRNLLGIGEVVAHLEENCDHSFTLSQLARMARMSTRGFTRAFREAMGTSPIDYILRLRIRRAAVLLENGACSVGEVAERTGFHDGNYFSRKFREIIGETPSAWRQARLVRTVE